MILTKQILLANGFKRTSYDEFYLGQSLWSSPFKLMTNLDGKFFLLKYTGAGFDFPDGDEIETTEQLKDIYLKETGTELTLTQ